IGATPLVIAGIVTVAYVRSYGLLLTGIALYFMGYYIYYTAYQALYPDILPSNQYGRAWAYQSLFQGAGAGLALLGGGALARSDDLSIPFLITAGVFFLVALLTVWLVEESSERTEPEPSRLIE